MLSLALILCTLVLTQLEPASGVPLSTENAPSAGRSVLVRLPRSFGMSQRVIADHGTEIYRLAEWKAACPVRGAKPHVIIIDRVVFEERRDSGYAIRTVAGEHDFPFACRVSPVRGRFTLIMVDPGHTHAPALAARTPDYVVP